MFIADSAAPFVYALLASIGGCVSVLFWVVTRDARRESPPPRPMRPRRAPPTTRRGRAR